MGSAHWRNLAITIEPTVCGDNEAFSSKYFDQLLSWILLRPVTNRTNNELSQLIREGFVKQIPLKSVYMIQPVWQPVGCLFARCSRLSHRLYNWTAGCQTGLTTGWMFVYTMQPVVQPVVKPVWQPVCNRLYCVYKHSSCKTGLTTGCIV